MSSWTYDKDGNWRPITDLDGNYHLWYLLEIMETSDIEKGKYLAKKYGGEAPEKYLKDYLNWIYERDNSYIVEPVD